MAHRFYSTCWAESRADRLKWRKDRKAEKTNEVGSWYRFTGSRNGAFGAVRRTNEHCADYADAKSALRNLRTISPEEISPEEKRTGQTRQTVIVTNTGKNAGKNTAVSTAENKTKEP